MKRKRSGEITVICGGMFAGKTEELIRLARRSLYAKKRMQVFKPEIDRRYHETMIVSHRGVEHAAESIGSSKDLVVKLSGETELVLVEEAQFLDSGIIDVAVSLADSGVDVVIAGLDQDFRRKPFGPMPQLLSIADVVIKLRAICAKCGLPASHTYRSINGRPAHANDPVVLIGASETYEARCRRCYRLRGEQPARTRPQPARKEDSPSASI